MRISDWSSDVCSSYLMMVMARGLAMGPRLLLLDEPSQGLAPIMVKAVAKVLNQLKSEDLTILLVEQNLNMALEISDRVVVLENGTRSEEHTSELQSLMRISYAVFCLKKQT